jgi:quercetin dioxygenase-like cupin family protein
MELVLLDRLFGECRNLFFGLSLFLRKGHPFANDLSHHHLHRRVTFPPGMPSNPPHHRSGAALYYIVSGTGANTIDGTTNTRGPGSLIYEPFGLVHQWGNPGSDPLTFLAFNINPDGVAAVLPDAPTKAQ